MKSRAPQITNARKGGLTLVLGLSLLPACGTEIGNGKKGNDKTAKNGYETPTTSGASAPIPEVADNTDTDSATTGESTSTSKGTLLDPILRACGSPIVDMKASSFANRPGSSTLTVSVLTASSWRLVLDQPALGVTIERDSSDPANTYAIKSSTLTLGKETCVSATSETTSGVTVKSITYSDGIKTTWTLDSNDEISDIKIFNAAGATILIFEPK